MTDLNPIKVKALELAVQSGGSQEEIVKRAGAYHGFLNGAAPAASAAGAASTASKTPPAGDTASKAAASAAAAKKVETAVKATKQQAPAGKPAAGAPTGASVATDTKAPGGTHSYGDVVNKLREVQNDPDLGREKAFAILASKGGGVKSVRDLKPASYDAVVGGCNAALNGEGENAGVAEPGAEFDDGTGAPETDELGLAV